MMTLAELRKLAKEVFPGANANLIRLLSAWAIRDPEGELAGLLFDTGLDTDGMASALKPLLAEPADEDKDLLISCITGVSNGPVTGGHLLLALCDSPSHRVSRILIEAGLNLERLRANLNGALELPAGVLAQYGIEVDTKANPLLRYGRDLTALAEEGAFDDLCDRPAEIDRLFEVLLRKRKGNVALTGPAGVGKTALIELLSHKVVSEEVPTHLIGTRLFELSMGKLVAGTKYRGEFEARMEQVIHAFLSSQPAILFIDEMHLIWGAGHAEGINTDAANLLKPMLAREGSRVIGATTVEEYHRYIARDAALARRFQEIRLSEPDEALTFEMIQKQAEGLANHHKLAIPDTIIRQAIELTNRHLPNRFQPDKSVDLLDSAAVSAVRADRKELLIVDLLDTLARQTGRPVSTLTGEDRLSLRNLEEQIKSRIIGQDEAVEKVAATLIYRRQDLGAVDRNLGTFLFAGETGVGKTELARTIATTFFSSEKGLLHVDLAEYNQPGSVNKLIGSPAGFVGSEKEGVLIDWLHTHGSGVLLFDEIEKAHEEIHRLLLGLLDNGRISSARGEIMDTRQCVVILTTNAIDPSDLKRSTVGFGGGTVRQDPAELLADYFPREFLGRLDEIVLFNPLGPKEMREIMKLRLSEALSRLNRKKIILNFDEEQLIDYLLDGLLESKSGARGIARLLENKLLQPISLALLYHDGEGELEIALGDEFYESGKVTISSKDLNTH